MVAVSNSYGDWIISWIFASAASTTEESRGVIREILLHCVSRSDQLINNHTKALVVARNFIQTDGIESYIRTATIWVLVSSTRNLLTAYCIRIAAAR